MSKHKMVPASAGARQFEYMKVNYDNNVRGDRAIDLMIASALEGWRLHTLVNYTRQLGELFFEREVGTWKVETEEEQNTNGDTEQNSDGETN